VLNITQVESSDQIVAVQELFREYIAWTNTFVESSLAPTFEGFEEELAALPGIFSPPAGRLLLAVHDGRAAGCIALKPHAGTTGELKRLYVRPAFRGLSIGRQLVDTLVREARQSGYQRLVLDTHISMKAAHALYAAAGFHTVPTPANFPAALKPLVVFMECDLAADR